MLLNCGVEEDSWDSFGLEGDPTSPSYRKSVWILIGRTETPILWPLDVKNWLIWKDSDAGKDWQCEEKRMTEDEMVGWHHRLNGHEFEQLWEIVKDRESWHAAVRGIAKNQAQLSDWTELNWTEKANPIRALWCPWVEETGIKAWKSQRGKSS